MTKLTEWLSLLTVLASVWYGIWMPNCHLFHPSNNRNKHLIQFHNKHTIYHSYVLFRICKNEVGFYELQEHRMRKCNKNNHNNMAKNQIQYQPRKFKKMLLTHTYTHPSMHTCSHSRTLTHTRAHLRTPTHTCTHTPHIPTDAR